MNHYKAPWSWTLIVVSITFTIVLLAIGLSNWNNIAELQISTFGFWLALLPLALIVTAALFVIRGYSITHDSILIHRLFWNTRLSRKDMQSVSIEPNALRGTIRTFGNGGLYSFTGWYHNTRLGSFQAFATDSIRTVVLRYENKTIVLTPDNQDTFVQELSGYQS